VGLKNYRYDVVWYLIMFLKFGFLSCPDEPDRYKPIVDALLNWGDHYMVLADFSSYVQAQSRVDSHFADTRAWRRSSLINIAAMGPFSSDRTIAEYVDQIWRCSPLKL